MTEADQRPRLRYVDLFPIPDEKGRRLFGLRDPRQISPHVLCISLEVAYLLQFLDGKHTIEQARSAYQKETRRDFPPDQLRQVVELLDQSYFLDNDSFRAYLSELEASFRAARVREAYHSGKSYSTDAVELRKSLSGFFSAPSGPGLPDGKVDGRVIPGMIVPHIDLRIGGRTYAWAYKHLAEAQHPDLVVVLGTAHSGVRNLFSLTRKRFVTPLGELPVDLDFIERLASLYPYNLFADELAHRTEHTIEFQVLFLQLLFGGRVPMVPILCSYAHSMAREGTAAELIQKFGAAVRSAVRHDGRRVCLVASADLAHVGPHYGDTEGFAGERLARIKEGDREMLRYAENVDGDGFLNYIAAEGDRRRICGLSPIHTMLKALEAKKGTVLDHDHGEMDNLGSICSYASVVFET